MRRLLLGAFLAVAIVCALLLILRALPLGARRPVVFLLVLVIHCRGGWRALLSTVHTRTDNRQERDQRRLRAQADGGRGRGGE